MKLGQRLKRIQSGGLIGALLAVLAGYALGHFPFGHGLVNRSYDLLFAPRSNIPVDGVRMIYMDDESYQAMGQNANAAWDRGLHAKLLDYLKADHARSVTFDVVFSDPGPEGPTDAKDQQFARALEANGTVVLAADMVRVGVGTGQLARRIVMPYDPFRGTNVTVGSAEMRADDDVVIRKHLRTSPDEEISSLAWATADLLGAEVTRKKKPYENERWINYYGPPLTLPSVSYYRVFEPPESNEKVPIGYFSNRVVFVGAHQSTKFAGERKDEFSTPYSFWLAKDLFIPGVEVQATIAMNLMRGDWISDVAQVNWWFLVLGLVFGFGLASLRPFAAVAVAALSALAIVLASYLLFTRHHLLFPWLIPVAVQIPIALLWSIVYNSVRLYVQNRLFEQSLKMYLSPKLVKKFASDRDLLKIGAKTQMLTILFTDIASFTSISEGLNGDELADLMNKYFQSAVSDCIFPQDGTIVKYIGDAIFALWNAPEPQADHAIRACEAALLFREQPVHEINGKQLITRLGLHTGEAKVGNFGSTDRYDYTALGENINLAARMEGLNKYLGTLNLITGHTHALVVGKVLTRFLGKFQLKGFEKAVDVHELVGRIDKAETLRPLHEAFAEAVKIFLQKDIPGAEAAFRRALVIKPDDGPSKFYIKFIAELHEHPLPDDWGGEIELKEK